MQVFKSLIYAFYLILCGCISILGLFYSIDSFSHSHLQASLEVYPWIYLVLFCSAVIISGCAFYSEKKRNFIVFLSLFATVSLGETSGRFALHALVLSHVFKDIIKHQEYLKKIPGGFMLLLVSNLFFLSYLNSLSTFLWFRFDYILFSDILKDTGSFKYALTESGLSEVLRDVMYALEFISCGILCYLIRKRSSEEVLQDSLKQILVALTGILPVFLFLQIQQIHPLMRINQNEFWNYAGRYSGIFSDPNSLGIMSGMFLFLILQLIKTHRVVLLLSMLLLFSSSFSGSRTFFIFFFPFFFSYLFKYLKPAKTKVKVVSLTAFSLLLFILLFFLSPLLPSFERIVNTANPAKIVNMLESRLIYSRLALSAIKEEPLHGLGLSRFYSEQERLAHKNDITLLNWRDNANNYYLQIAAESGIPGLLLVLYCFYLLLLPSIRSKEYPYFRLLIGVFFISLLTGPHLFFIEVRSLLFIIVIFLLDDEKREKENNRILLVLLFFVIAFIACSPWWKEQKIDLGLYNVEYSEQDGYFRWTGSKALIRLDDHTDKNVLEIKNALYEFCAENDRLVQIRFFDGSKDSYEPYSVQVFKTEKTWTQIEVPHNSDKIEILSPCRISPIRSELSNDFRSLGVQLRFSKYLN